MATLFDVNTVLTHRAVFEYRDQHHIVYGPNGKVGWQLPSVFEIREAVQAPREILQSAKVTTSFLYVKPVGTVGANQWFTLAIVDSIKGRVNTAFNLTTYHQKGTKVWPTAVPVTVPASP